MGERLEGNLQERLRELREEHGYKSMHKLADVLKIDRATYSRIENGVTKTISSDLLIKLANLYDVSADYILGLSSTPEKTYDDIKELGLSIEAAKNLSSSKVDSRVINELLLNNKFATVTKLLAGYYTDVTNSVYEGKNKALDFNYELIESTVNQGSLPNDSDIKELMRKIKTQKEPTTQADLDRIRNTFMAAIKEIRDKITTEVEATDISKILEADVIENFKKEVDINKALAMKTDDERAKYIATAMACATGVTTDINPEQMDEIVSGFENLLKTFSK